MQVGKADFANTAFLFADNRNLYTIENDGSLYRISPGNGAWVRIGQAGAWRNTTAGVMLNDILFTIEQGGALYRTDLATGSWVQLGKAEYGNTRFLLPGGRNLYTIEADGSLYRVNPLNGSWVRVGAAGAWRNTIVGAGLNGQLYTVEQGGALYETNPTTGTVAPNRQSRIRADECSVQRHGCLYSLEAGNLYRINPSNGSWASAYKV